MKKNGKPTRHKDEMDVDKASALDVYLRFKLYPRPDAVGKKSKVWFLPISLGLSRVPRFSRRNDSQRFEVLLTV